ncbi:hypothetical protein [Streptomyces cyaneofuscatus]|uniref:hypothetical protein n=1 Tax=Streptomyces cyaneofuscatus TaxID=66883 RepID=UPI0036DAAF5B
MTASTARLSLRTAVLAAAAAAAVLVPSTVAFADATPRPSAPAESAPAVSPERAKAAQAAEAAPTAARPSVAPRGGVAAGDRPAPAAPREARPAPAVVPRGGVAAGERPAGTGGDNSTTALAGSVAGAALLAGAGTLVLRRRNG